MFLKLSQVTVLTVKGNKKIMHSRYTDARTMKPDTVPFVTTSSGWSKTRAMIQVRRNVNVGVAVNVFISFLFLLLIIVPEGVVLAFRPITTTSRRLTTSLSFLPHQQRSDTGHRQPPKGMASFAPLISVSGKSHRNYVQNGVCRAPTIRFMASQSPLTETEVRKGIDTVVAALRKDSRTNQELGKLQRVTTILGSGLQQMNTILAVRFNASFQRSGPGWSSVPLPFGLGQSNVSEGRGTMVGQVKASINLKTGKVISCSVFRDLGYGRTFDLKV